MGKFLRQLTQVHVFFIMYIPPTPRSGQVASSLEVLLLAWISKKKNHSFLFNDHE